MSNILFLQGNATPFWATLARRLASRGHRVSGIHLNGADRAFCRFPKSTDYRSNLARWPAWLDNHLASLQPDAIMLFGRHRPHHLPAITLAAQRNIAVWAFDEGYWRPGYVTCERLAPEATPLLPAALTAHAPCQAPPAAPTPPGTFAERAAFDVAYHLLRVALHPCYPSYRPHHAVDPFIEYAAYLPNLLLGPMRRQRGRAVLDRMQAGHAFLFPMQMEGDFQILARSPFSGNLDALAFVLASFARSAPPEAMLAIKSHPLDPGMRNWARDIERLAARFNLAGHVVFFHTHDLDRAVRACRGIVTINSTVGTLGLASGKPVLALGEALYAMPGLARRGAEIDRFWTDPPAPDAALVEAFRGVLTAKFLVPGDFFSREGREMAAAAAAVRIG